PSPGTATSLAESPSGTLVLATSAGIEVSADGGATWTAARGARPAGGFAYVGMTTATQGVAVPADPSRRAIWFTHHGGSAGPASPGGARAQGRVPAPAPQPPPTPPRGGGRRG